MIVAEFPLSRILRVVRWLYDQTFSRLSLAFWTRWAGRYYGLEFCRKAAWAVTPSGRGLSKPLELARLLRRGLIAGQDLLFIGAGEGKEILPWLSCRPRSVCAIDLQDYRAAWQPLSKNYSGPPFRFIQSDAGALPFREDSFDLLASFTVLEHLRSLKNHFREAHRVLRPGGRCYAVFGPLWRTFKGSHLDSLGYRHLLLDEDALLKLVKESADPEREWLEKGLLNRCRYEDYLDALKPYFQIEYQAWILSFQGLRFRRKNPLAWKKLREQHSERDLLLSSVYWLLRKRP